MFSKNGMVKRSLLKDFKVNRYNKPLCSMKLKGNDLVVSVTDKVGSEVFITTHNGNALRYDINEIAIVGVKAAGVKAISLKDNDTVTSGDVYNGEDYVLVLTDKGTAKRVKVSEFEKTSRARRGIQIIRDVKTNPYHIINSFIINNKNNIGILFKEDIEYKKVTDIPILDRYSTGNNLSNQTINGMFIEKDIINPKEIKEEIKEVSLESIDDKIMTIDDFLKDFEK
jgi:topoisomerase-4 subunit A